MKIFFSLLLSLFSTFTSYALPVSTNDFVVSGLLYDSLSSSPEAYATVRILHEGKNKPVKITTTDVNGQFSLVVSRPGTYNIQLSSLGKQTLEKKIVLGKSGRVDMGKLFLKEHNTALGTATVMAQRPIVKAEVDKISYSMKEDPDAQSNNLLEMLRKVPMVTVDGEDKIQVNGNTSFKVYVNGKPNEMMSNNASLILKNYPASMVKKIEVITDPGAKYDAEGLAGILNIVTDTETTTSGYTFSPNIGFTNRGIKGGVFGMVQLGRFMLSANYGIGTSKRPTSTSSSEREVYDDALNHLLTSSGSGKNKGLYQYGSFDGSYEFDKKNLLTFNLGLHGHKNDRNYNTSYSMFAADGTKTYSYNVLSDATKKNFSLNTGVDFQHTFSQPGRLFTLSYRLNTSPQNNQENTFYTHMENVPFELKDLSTDPDNKSYEHTAQIDFTTPFGKLHTFSTGLKYIYRVNKSDNVEMNRAAESSDAFVKDEAASLRYKNRTDIAAAYAEYGLKLGAFSTRAGVRYEYSNVKVSYPDGKRENFSSNFNDIVPTVNFGYNISQTQLLKLGYNLRIGRPSIYYLSPYVQHNDPLSITYGQPDLESEQGHNFSLGYSLFGPKFSINSTLTYALSNNGLATFSFIKEGVRHTTYANALHSKVTNLNLYMNWMIAKGTSLNLNGNVSYSDYKTYLTHDSNDGFSGSLFGGIRQNLPWKLKLGFWGGYGSGSVNLQGKSSDYHFYSMHLSRSFLKNDQLTVTLNAGNFFDGKKKMTSSMTTDQFRFNSVNRFDFLRYGISFRYNLGQLKAKVKKVSRTIVNSDVISGKGSDVENGEKADSKEM